LELLRNEFPTFLKLDRQITQNQTKKAAAINSTPIFKKNLLHLYLLSLEIRTVYQPLLF